MASLEQIEGTILTEGLGSGRGTRFATPSSSRRLETGGGQRGVQGGGLADTTNIDPNSIQFRSRNLDPLETKPMITSGSGVSPQAVDSVADMLTKAAFTYADRVDAVKADEAVLSFNEFARTAYYGDPEQGLEGLSNLRGAAAVSARSQFFEGIDAKLGELVNGMEPGVKNKALARLSSIRDTALNRASGHIAQAQRENEEQVQVAKIRDIERELSVDYANAPQLKDAVAGVFGIDSKGANEAWDSVGINALNKTYLDAYKTTGSGIEAAKKFQESVKDTLSVKANNVMDNYILAQEHHEEVAKKSEEADLKREQKEGLDNKLAEVTAAFDDNHGLIKSLSDIYVIAPEFMNSRGHASALWRYTNSIRKQEAGETIQERKNDFIIDVMNPMREEGKAFPDESAFMESAMDYGITDRRTMRSLWTDMKSKLSDDQRTLNQQYGDISKRIKGAYKSAPVELEPLPPNATKEQKSAYSMRMLASTLGGQKAEEPQWAKEMHSALATIYQDKKLTPYERAEKIEKYVKTKMTEAGVAKELANIQNIEVLANQYKFQTYVGGLKERDNSVSTTDPGDEFFPKPLPGTYTPEEEQLPDAERRFIASGYGLAPTSKSRDKILQAAERAGAIQVEFVEDEELGGKPYTGYVGSFKQADGTYRRQRVGIRKK